MFIIPCYLQENSYLRGEPMAKVFTWDAVRNGRIPEPQSFCKMADRLRSEFSGSIAVIAASLLGSFQHGCFNRRSDLDCIVIYDEGMAIEVHALIRVLKLDAAELFLPLEIVSMDKVVAASELSNVGNTFGEHIDACAIKGGLIKGDVSSMLHQWPDIIEDLVSYMRGKIRQMEKGMGDIPVLSEPDLCHFLQKCLEAPVHIGRKLMRCQRVDLPDDSKRTVAKYLPKHIDTVIAQTFEEIMAIDRHYTQELERQLAMPDESRYFEEMDKLIACTRLSFDFVRTVSLQFESTLRS